MGYAPGERREERGERREERGERREEREAVAAMHESANGPSLPTSALHNRVS
jgi:hypothetical protein